MLREFKQNPRIRLLAICCLGIMAIFVMRLFYLQVIEHDKYAAMADREQLKRLSIPAKRGEIYMMDDGKLAKVVMNQTVYTMFVDPTVMDDKPAVIKAIREVVGGNTVDGYKDRLNNNDSQYERVATQVSHTQAELVKKRGLKGVGFQAETKRVYPEKTLAAQTLGFVNFDGVGQYGVESKYESELKGRPGLLQSVTDVANVPLTIGNKNIDVPAKDGSDLVLSLDRNVQAYAEDALRRGLKRSGGDKGSVIVMDPNTGKIKAMANAPTYDPGKFVTVQDAAAFNNGVVSSPYEPGSVIKTFTMATGIDTGTVTADSTYVNTDSIQVEDRIIGNATKGQTGTISMQHALNWSLNTGMVTLAERIGGGSINDKSRSIMYKYFHDKFRLGQKTGIEVAGEAKGRIIPPDQIEGNAVRYSNMSFGQGMDLTMVQVASSFCAMINGGVYNTPTVLEGRLNSNGDIIPANKRPTYPDVIKQTTSEQMKEMIVKARRAFYADNDRKGYMIGGKTGTSQTLVNGSYEDGKTVGTYLGFGGDDKPKYVIMVQVAGENVDLAGGTDAMPIFTDISNWMIDYLTLQPKG